MNKNLVNVEMSGIRKFSNKVKNIDGAISLTLGQPDFNVPDVVRDGLLKAIKNNNTVYTENAGILPLRDEITKYLGKRNIKYSADEICITVGGSEALFSIFTALINAGDKVLIPDPAYPAYESSQAGGPIRVVAAGLCHSHSNTGSEPHLMATPDP